MRCIREKGFWIATALLGAAGIALTLWLAAWAAGYVVWRLDAAVVAAALFALLLLSGCAARLLLQIRLKRGDVGLRRPMLWWYRLACIALAVFALVQCFVVSGMKRQKVYTANTMIVLGAGIIGDQPAVMLEKRLRVAAEILHEYPNMNAIVSGGQGADEIMPESRVMKRYLIEHGINEARVFEDDISNNTTAQIVAACALVKSDNSGERGLLIVSSDYHLYRASLLAKRAGVQAEVASSNTSWTVRPFAHTRETMSIVWTWLGLDFERI